jgi:hypothetical protein|tara:strand:+ start:125 stop:481 length:357 start_codon:yes stop_codon:yes gene_type:complete
MLSALGKLLKFFIILIAIVIGITYFTGTEVSNSDNQESINKTQQTTSNSSTSVTKTEAKPDRWWEKTDKYAICYGRVTQAHKDNGLHDRDRDKSIEIKKELCKIAATSTTGEGSFWIE